MEREESKPTKKYKKKKSKLYSTLESAKGEKKMERERLKALGDPVSNGKVQG